MASLRDVAAFAAKAVATQAGMGLLGLNPGGKRKKDDSTKKALVVGTGLALLKGAASAGAGVATKALATKAGMAMLGLNPKMVTRKGVLVRASRKQLRAYLARVKALERSRIKLAETMGKTLRAKTEAGRDMLWSRALGGIKKEIGKIKRTEKLLGLRANPAMRAKLGRPLSAKAKAARRAKVARAMKSGAHQLAGLGAKFGGPRAKFARVRIASPREFQKGSFRVISPGSGAHKMVIACPKATPLTGGKCKGGTEVQAVLVRKVSAAERKADMKVAANPLLMVVPNPRVKWVPFGRGYVYAVESSGGRYPSWHWAVRRTNTIHGSAASGGSGADSKAAAIAWAKDHITRAMATDKRRKMWERTHGPLFGRNPATARKGDPLVLKTANEAWGFFGTTAQMYGQAVAEYAWDVAFKELLKGGWKPYTVRLFLDAKHGRHVADQVYIQGIADKAKIRTAVLKALKSEMRWIVRTMPDMDAERRKGGVRWNPGSTPPPMKMTEFLNDITADVKDLPSKGWLKTAAASHLRRWAARQGHPMSQVVAEDIVSRWIRAKAGVEWNPGKKICGNMISINLHRGGYPTLIHESAKWAIRKRDRGIWSPSDYKNALMREWENLGQGGGYSSGFSFRRRDPETGIVVELIETFNTPLAVFILTRKEAGENPGRTLVPGGKGRDSVVLGWKSKAEAEKYVAKKNREGFVASVHPGRAGAPASARWVTISSRHKMFFKGPWGKNPSANPTYLLTPRICDLRTIATSGVAGVVDGRKIDPVIAGAVLKFLAAQAPANAERLAKEPVMQLAGYAYKNAKRR